MADQTDRNFINSLANGLQIIMTFTAESPRLKLTDIARANQMNLPTARRYLHTLSKLGFIMKDEIDQTFQLTAKVMRLGSGVFSNMDLKDRLLPFMKKLNRELDITINIAIFEGNEAVTIDRLRSKDVVNLDITAGTRLPIYATSLGKALLAFLPKKTQESIVNKLSFKPLTPHTITDSVLFLQTLQQTKKRGYAIAREELTLGLKTLAVPIFNGVGTVIASFGVSYPIHRENNKIWEDKVIKSLLSVKEECC